MSQPEEVKSAGGIAPFGYRWQNGKLVVDEREAIVRKLIYELYLKHRRKKTVARLLNDAGYRTRTDSLFSDTTIDRLIRDATAKGIRFVDGKEIRVDPIVETAVWERANNILNANSKQKITKQSAELFSGLAFCSCGGKIIVPSNLAKYVCLECRHKIEAGDLEEIFASQLAGFPVELENSPDSNLSDYWHLLTSKEKRIVVEQICDKILIGTSSIEIEFACAPNSLKTATFEQQNSAGNKTSEPEIISSSTEPNQPALNEPLMNETEASKFLGISRMTLLRKRNNGEIGFFRVGFRILYSKEKHLIPFLDRCEKKG